MDAFTAATAYCTPTATASDYEEWTNGVGTTCACTAQPAYVERKWRIGMGTATS
jgi:hypothetical protein